jgi:hypothetical protein
VLAIADFWHASIASAFRPRRRKGRYISWIDAIRDITEQAPAAVAMFDDKMRFLAVSRRFLSDNELREAAKVIGHSDLRDIPRHAAAMARDSYPCAGRQGTGL